jgi:hypothetical protein
LVQRHILFASVRANSTGRFGRESKQSFNGRARAASHPLLKHLAQENEGHDHSGRLEVQDLGSFLRRIAPGCENTIRGAKDHLFD